MSDCRAELCPYWPGEGCVRGVMPCEDDEPERPCPRGVEDCDGLSCCWTCPEDGCQNCHEAFCYLCGGGDPRDE